MPMSEPLKASISPKAMSTEWCISPIGGQRKPHASNAHPKMHRLTAKNNCTFFMIAFVFFYSHGSHGFPRITKKISAYQFNLWKGKSVKFFLLFPRISRINTDNKEDPCKSVKSVETTTSYLPFASSSLQMSKTKAWRVLNLDCLAKAVMSVAMKAGSSKRSRVICAISANLVFQVFWLSVSLVFFRGSR